MNIDFKKQGGLVPVIIQHSLSNQVLMLGYMNDVAFHKTKIDKKVTFYSRSKERLWTKGESSGNYLHVISIQSDCDNDTLLIKVIPDGPTCHTGSVTCFQEETPKGFVYELEETIHRRIAADDPSSYTAQLVKGGIDKVAQKVGEEAVEVVIESKNDNLDLFIGEAADLLYHFLILLKAKCVSLETIEARLKKRSQKPKA